MSSAYPPATRFAFHAALWLAGATAPAQGPTLTTATPTGVWATDGSTTVVQAIPANQAIGQRAEAAAVIGREAWAALSAEAIGPDLFSITENAAVLRGPAAPAAGTTASSGGPGSTPGPHDFVLKAPSTAAQPLQLSLALRGSATPGAQLLVAIDVGVDGSFEWQQLVTGTVESAVLPLTGPAGTDVLVQLTGSVSLPAGATGARYAAVLDLDVQPLGEQPCGITQLGTTCGAILTGADQVGPGSTHRFALTMNSALPSTPVVWVLGNGMVNLPLPNSTCRLLVAPLVGVPGNTDAAGTARLAASATGPLGGRVWIQAVPVVVPAVGAPVLHSSNALLIDCH